MKVSLNKFILVKILDKENVTFLEESQTVHKSKRTQWFHQNLYGSVGLMFISILFLALFIDWHFDFYEQIFNGKLTLISFNILAAMLGFLIQSKKNYNENYDHNSMFKLRKSLLWYTLLIAFINALIYFAQYSSKFVSALTTWYNKIIIAVLTVLFFIMSFDLASLIYITQDEFAEETFAEQMKNKTNSYSNDIDQIII